MQIPYYKSGFYYTPRRDNSPKVTTTGHSLPCFQQKGKFYNICFRLADSLPANVLQEMQEKMDTWRSEHPGLAYPESEAQREEFRQMEKWLHQGHGSCILKDQMIQKIMWNVILSHDEKECQVGSFVIMGNHIHLVVKMLKQNDMIDLVQHIKQESTIAINNYLGECNKVIWMRGSFTRIIRSPKELEKALKYIEDNPKNTGIQVYVRPDDRPFTR